MKHRKFGIEIEMSTELEQVDKIISPLIPKKQYLYTDCAEKSNGKYWHLKKDSSTETEFATPILKFEDKQGLKILKTTLAALNKKKVSVTRHDGLHVHIDCKDIDCNKLLIAWIYLEKSIKQLFPRYRTKCVYKNVSYCESYLNSKNKKIIANYFNKMKDRSKDHHSAISFQSYEERQTVEFRWHEGTIDYNEMICWIKFIHYFLAYAKKDIDVTEALCSPTKLFDCYMLINLLEINDQTVITWVKDRYDKFYK